MTKDDFYVGQKLLIMQFLNADIKECTVQKIGRDFIWLDDDFRIDLKSMEIQWKKDGLWSFTNSFLHFFDAKEYAKKLKLINCLDNSINRYNKYVQKHGTCKKLGEQIFVKPIKDRLLFSSSIEYIQSLIENVEKEFVELDKRRTTYKEQKKKNEQDKKSDN